MSDACWRCDPEGDHSTGDDLCTKCHEEAWPVDRKPVIDPRDATIAALTARVAELAASTRVRDEQATTLEAAHAAAVTFYQSLVPWFSDIEIPQESWDALAAMKLACDEAMNPEPKP